ncbi:MAG: type II toxin-antitoxin system PemK/MazF family toxin [Clostridia bacterium]|jgi:mRNA interferase MazF|nr:type II toxin-antitoxin system PemK/MazF family toxin [Clostridia bacterium]MDD3093282.1 type II toxin-antitoxin system PemK/MazF family toxin [Clostridia bacterium]MDD3971819.1 type II toxin-antitoxin system PemK/MazF family toxin [Clostridia bacterium]MDD4579005.1 type II toxin-antitoxin system PemK/MazF family toxin [Anaerolineaceae bacterium]
MKEIKRGEVYYSDLNPILGSEQGGVRPVVILQNDAGNQYSPTTIVAAITSITKKHRLPTHVFVDCNFLDKESIVLLEHNVKSWLMLNFTRIPPLFEKNCRLNFTLNFMPK